MPFFKTMWSHRELKWNQTRHRYKHFNWWPMTKNCFTSQTSIEIDMRRVKICSCIFCFFLKMPKTPFMPIMTLSEVHVKGNISRFYWWWNLILEQYRENNVEVGGSEKSQFGYLIPTVRKKYVKGKLWKSIHWVGHVVTQ